MSAMPNADWTLDLCIRCRLSIREVRLQTRNRLNVIAGKNGCGKTQLLTIIHSHENTLRDQLLQDLGHRNYFPREMSAVQITGPTRIHFIQAARILACDPEERRGPAYTFGELAGEFDPRKRYTKLRWCLSKLALDAHQHTSRFVRDTRKAVLAKIQEAFADLFPGRSLVVEVDAEKQEVRVFGASSGMEFVRPDDPRFSPLAPFACLSDGELNVVFLLFQLLFFSHSGSTRLLFLIDEIENHLRPDTQARFIDLLARCLPSNTIVLATTHSPQVLLSVPPECRFGMVHSAERTSNDDLYQNQLLPNDQVTSASEMLYELYGASSGSTGTALLSAIDAETSGYAVSFAEECFQKPDAKDECKSCDLQRTVLSGIVQGAAKAGRPLRILDVGAGKGREIAALRDDFSSARSSFVLLDVVEPDESHRKYLTQLQDKRGTAVRVERVFSRFDDVEPNVKYDQIWLHNVLHELGTDDLLALLSMLPDILSPAGALSVLEQAVLPHGEPAFFVYDPSELAKVLEPFGLASNWASRSSYSGIELYELTAHANGELRRPDREVILTSLRTATQNTIVKSVRSFRDAQCRCVDPTRLAFLAFNVANGHSRLLHVESHLQTQDQTGASGTATRRTKR